MPTTYDFDKDVVNISKLAEEILKSAITNVTTEFQGIVDDKTVSPGLNLHITFANALSAGDQTVLGNLVTAHPTAVVNDPGEPVYFVDVGGVTGYPAADGSIITNAGKFDLKYAIADTAGTPYLVTNSTTFVAASRFGYPGNNNLTSIPNNITVVCSAASDTSTGEYRVQDITNAQTIATAILNTNIAPTVQSLGTVSNLPANQAVFEVQFRKVTGGQARLGFIRLTRV